MRESHSFHFFLPDGRRLATFLEDWRLDKIEIEKNLMDSDRSRLAEEEEEEEEERWMDGWMDDEDDDDDDDDDE